MAKGSRGYKKKIKTKTPKVTPEAAGKEDDDNEVEVVAEVTLEQRLAANRQAARARGEVIVIDHDVVYVGRRGRH